MRLNYIKYLGQKKSLNFLTDKLLDKKVELTRDIFNHQPVELKNLVLESEHDTEKTIEATTKWVYSDIELYGKDKVSYAFYFNGKARFTINGKTQEVKVGDNITVGRSVSKELFVENNEPTGNTKSGREYSNKVLMITERGVYVDCDYKDKVIKYKPNSDAEFFDRDLTDFPYKNDTSSDPAHIPGRRPRGGR